MGLKAFTILAFTEETMLLTVQYEDDNSQGDFTIMTVTIPESLAASEIDQLIISNYPGPLHRTLSKRNMTVPIRARLMGTVGVRRVVTP